MTETSSVFDLPDRLAAKRSPQLIAADERQLEHIVSCLARSIDELSDRLDHTRLLPGGSGQQALERDLAIHESTARLRALRRYGADLCLGRMVPEDGGRALYVGRLGLVDGDGERLLVDWRSSAAEPFFGATLASPMGLASRRRYRWTRGRITDYWDEAFTEEGFDDPVALDDQSAFIASLGSSRSARMRDVLGTIQSDQDVIIRATSRGALVVDGGPGTGKTVVALHRAAYLLYSDPRLARGRGSVLFVGPSHGYLAYIDDVLPSLGEEGVQICTIADLVAEGADARRELDQRVAHLKASLILVDAVEAAVARYERPPTRSTTVETPWGDVELDGDSWSDAFDAAERGMPHNEAREQVWDELVDIIAAGIDDDVPGNQLRRALAQNDDLRATFNRAWPLLDPAGVVADLWSVPAYIRRCAPGLGAEDILALQRSDARAWTDADLPLLDAARQRIGDPGAARAAARRSATLAADREQMARVIDDLIAADDSELHLMSMLREEDAQNSLIDDSSLPAADPDVLAGPFAHIVVDEAQELSDAEWQMLLRRCPSRSLTIVGDRAQARHGFAETWEQRLAAVGLGDIVVSTLHINYRTPTEVMDEAAPVIRAAIPDANVPTSVRSSGIPVARAARSELEHIVMEWLAKNTDGVVCVIGARDDEWPVLRANARVRFLSPELSKGREFDLVVLIDPVPSASIEHAVDRYVAMTRATQRLVLVGVSD